MLAFQIADKFADQWLLFRSPLAIALQSRYQRVLTNIPLLAPGLKSRWLTLHHLHNALINNLLAQLPAIQISPHQLLASYENSPPQHLAGRWTNALDQVLLNEYTAIASLFLDTHGIPNPAFLPDALRILCATYPCVCNALKTFDPKEIAAEMNRLQPQSMYSAKMLCLLFSMNFIEARVLIFPESRSNY